jgi:MOSC domain-containing protein
MTEAPGRVAWIAIAPVKSMALAFLNEAVLGPDGIAGDRAFALVDAAGRLLNGKRAGVLATVRVAIDPAAGTLTLHLPTGESASGRPTLGDPIEAIVLGHPRPARVVDGPWSATLGAWSGHDLRLVAMPVGVGLDRGPSATLVSTAALGALAAVRVGTEPLDRRRFRMTFGVDGIEAYAEDHWIGRRVRMGEAVVRIAGNVGRCAVTTHDPDTGRPTFDTLHALQQSRGHLPSSEPLPFGVWSEIVEPGRVALGDAVTVEP